MFKKVRIKKMPTMAYGGKVFNQVAPNALPDKTGKPPIKVKDTLQPVAREGANIEAEKGETAFFLDVNGLPAHYKIGGKRHSKGGTPLNVPEDTFIFSDTKSMTIKDPELLAQFGETKPKTPAEIAKKYDLNTYRKVLADRDTDALRRKTAEQMIQNYTLSLGKLALIQESMKGFPQGIPTISQPYLVVNNISPEEILPMSNKGEEEGEGNQPEAQEMEQQPQGPEQEAPEEMMQQQMQGGPEMQFAYGGSNPFYYNPLHQFVYGNGGLVRYDNGGPGNPPKEDPWQRYRQNELGYQNRVYSYQTDPEWFNSHANVWESGNSKNDEKWNEIVKNKVYAGTHGFNPVTGELVRLDAKADVPVATQEKATKDYAKKSYQERMTSNTPAGEENRKAVVAQGMKDMVQNPVLYAPGAVAAATLAGPSVIPAIGEALSYPAVIGSTTLPGITAGNMIGLGGGLYSANMLGNDLNTGYYGSDAPLIDRIARGLETGIGIIGSPGVIEGIGAGFNQGAKLFKGLGNIGRITRNNRPATTSKSLDEITSEINALNDDFETGIIPSRSEATTEDMQSLLDRLTGINKSLEEHIDPNDLSFDFDNIKDFKDYEKLKNQARSIEKEIQRTGPTKGPEQPTFYTNKEAADNLEQYFNYKAAEEYYKNFLKDSGRTESLFDESGLFDVGVFDRFDEGLKNLFPNVSKPTWFRDNKINTKEQSDLLRILTRNEPGSPYNRLSDRTSPTNLSYFAEDAGQAGGMMSSEQQDLLRIQNEVMDPTSWLNRNPKDYVMEFKNMTGLSADEIEKLNNTQLRDLAYDVVRKRMDSIRMTINNQERMNKGKGVTVNLPPESLNRYGGSISSKNTYAYGGSANPFTANPLQKYVYGTGGAAQKRKVRIVSLPTYQNGGPKKKTGTDIESSGVGERKTVLEFSPKFIQDLADLAEQGKVTGDFPQVEGWTPEFQQRNADQSQVPGRRNIYGDRDWWKEGSEERADFERRHKWFLDQNPDFNPEKKEDVEKFQRAYCKRMKDYGAGSCWFVGEGQGGKGIRIDGVFGEHTWSAPSLNEAPIEEEIPVAPPKKTTAPPEPIPIQPLQVPPQNPPAFQYYPQDVLNLATAMTTQIPNPKTNYYALQFRGMDPAYLTPDYSPYMEAMNQRMQGLQSYGSRQGFGADASVSQAKTAEAAAQHNLEVANRNVGIYNTAQQYNAEISNKNAMYNAEQRQADFDTREAYKADRIKAMNKKRADVAQLYNNMLDNATAAYNLNLMYPHYQTSPGRGGLVTFYNPEALRPDKDANISALEKQVNALKGLGFKKADIVRILSGKNADKYYEEDSYNNPYDVPYGYLPHSPMNPEQ